MRTHPASAHSALLALVLLASLSASTRAQTGPGSITGTVEGSSSAIRITGAVITIVNETTRLFRSTITNETGMYEIPFLAPGLYTVRSEHPEYAATAIRGIRLTARQAARVDFQLKPATNGTDMEVDFGGASQLTDRAELGASIGHYEIAVLPLASRDFAGLQILSPGVQPGSSVGGFAGRELSEGFRIAGGTIYNGAFSVEQADNNRTYYYGNASSPSLEIIEEVSVEEAGTSSAYRGGSYNVDVSLKSGSGNLQGSVFEYLQHDQMNADNVMSGAKPPHLRRSQHGGSISGPLRKDSLFLIGVYEGIRQRKAEAMTSQVATQDQRNGIFPLAGGEAVIVRDPLTNKPFPANQIPASRFSPLARYFLDHVWPLPNSGTQLYRENTMQVVDSDQLHVKMDYIPDKSNTFALHVSGQKLAFADEIRQSLLSPQTDRFNNVLAGIRYTRSVSSVMVNSLLVSARSDFNTAQSTADLSEGVSFADGIGMKLGGPVGTGYPVISISGRGFTGRTGQLNTPTEHSGKTYQIQDTFRWMAGRHGLSFGLEAKRFQNNEQDDGTSVGQFNFNGRYSNSGLADFFLGLPNQVAYAPEMGRIYLRNTLWSAYAQDDWRIRKNLTLNLGIRYEYLSWPTERYNRMATSYPHLGMQAIVSADAGQLPERLDPAAVASFPAGTFITSEQARIPRSLRFPDRNNFAPHLGVAYRFASNMVVRGGYGIDYVKNSQAVFNDREAGFGLPFRISRLVVNPNPLSFDILEPFGDLAPKVRNVMESAWYVDPHFKMAYMQTWSLNIETRIPFSSVLQVGYLGNHLVHGKQTWNWNQSLTWPNRNDRFPGYGNILALTSGADSRYNSLQVRLRRQFTPGLVGQANYTWSKTLSNIVPEGEPVSIWVHNPGMQWGRSRWDRSHLWTGSFVYQLPFGKGRKWLHSLPRLLDGMAGGWQLSGIVKLMSGKPLTITSSLARANLSVQGAVPADRLSEGRLEHPNSGRWFDPLAFTTPPASRPGNAGYGILDGPGFMTEDVALYKSIRLREAATMQLRFEAYNALNHVNLGDPISDVDNWNLLGKILASGSALRAQIALRIDF